MYVFLDLVVLREKKTIRIREKAEWKSKCVVYCLLSLNREMIKLFQMLGLTRSLNNFSLFDAHKFEQSTILNARLNVSKQQI